MAWRLTADLEEYAGAVLPLLQARPDRHTISLTVIENLGAGFPMPGRPLFAYWTEDDGTATGAASHTPPYELLLADMPTEAVGPLVDALLAVERELPGVNGPETLAAAFAAHWQERSRRRASPFRAERLYRLGRLVPPDRLPPGRPRVATREDSALLVDWLDQFVEETETRGGDSRDAVADRLSFGGLTLWVTPDREPVSLAGRTRAAAGMVRIGPVFTPPDQRGRGYAAAVTVAVSRAAEESGAGMVLLFTDLANPATNRLYQRIGYAPVEDRRVLRFS